MKQFFDIDQQISDATYMESFLIPQLLTSLDEAVKWEKEGKNPGQVAANLAMLSTELERLQKVYPTASPLRKADLKRAGTI